jgi:glycosyltransferase involved in cell wall biosynthesis
MQQDVADLEVLVVDDNSSDATFQVLEALREANCSLNFMKNVRSPGPSGARNTGLLNSNSEYVAFLDSDDEWRPGWLKAVANRERFDQLLRRTIFSKQLVSDYRGARAFP